MAAQFLAILALLVAMHIASASDPNQLEDFCVAPDNPSNAVWTNGQMCKNPTEVTVDDFLFRGGSNVFVDASKLPGLNTLGLSVVKANISVGGLWPPHYHPRATEVLAILKGNLDVGFVSFNQSTNTAKQYSRTLSAGDVFVFPQGLLHFVHNLGDSNVLGVVAYSSQNPGAVFTPPALFKTQPPISVDLLSKAFKLDPEIVKDLQSNN